MTCLTDAACEEIARDLTGIASDWWRDHQREVQDLAVYEAKAVAANMMHGKGDDAATLLYLSMDPRTLLAAMRSTTQDIRALNERAARRADLAASILDLAPDILRVIGAAIWKRL